VSCAAFVVMGLVTLLVIVTPAARNFWAFLGCFIVLFIASGVGNGAVYRMIPTVFARRGGVGDAHSQSGDVSTRRKTAAALGVIAAVGAYGGFAVPQLLGASQSRFGDYTHALWWFVAAYAGFLVVTVAVYLIPSLARGHRV
jgi:NNP family nitrate/nitrite transporter-like MFS transporter